MTTKFSLFPAAAAPATTDKVAGLQGGVDVLYTLAQIGALVGSLKFEANIGDGTNVAYTVTHNLGTRDVDVTIYRNATPWDSIIVDVARPSINTILVTFTIPPTTNQFRVKVTA